MVVVKVKGYDINVINVRSAHSRKALKFHNDIINTLKLLGLTSDDVLIDLEPNGMKRVSASVSWYLDGQHLHYSYQGFKYVENLYVISKLLSLEVDAIVRGLKSVEQFIFDFSENEDVEKERLAAREYFGLPSDCVDMKLIDKKYKLLAKKLHPDMPDGNLEKFKELNRAHKCLKRELE